MRVFPGIVIALCAWAFVFCASYAYADDADVMQPETVGTEEQAKAATNDDSSVNERTEDVTSEEPTDEQLDDGKRGLMLTSGTRAATAVTLDQVNNNVLAVPGNVWGMKVTSSVSDIKWSQWFTYPTWYDRSTQITRKTLWGQVEETNNRSATILENTNQANYDIAVLQQNQENQNRVLSGLQTDLTQVKSDVADIKSSSGAGNASQLADVLKVTNSLLLIAVCLLAAIFGSNLLPMLVKGWRK